MDFHDLQSKPQARKRIKNLSAPGQGSLPGLPEALAIETATKAVQTPETSKEKNRVPKIRPEELEGTEERITSLCYLIDSVIDPEIRTANCANPNWPEIPRNSGPIDPGNPIAFLSWWELRTGAEKMLFSGNSLVQLRRFEGLLNSLEIAIGKREWLSLPDDHPGKRIFCRHWNVGPFKTCSCYGINDPLIFPAWTCESDPFFREQYPWNIGPFRCDRTMTGWPTHLSNGNPWTTEEMKKKMDQTDVSASADILDSM